MSLGGSSGPRKWDTKGRGRGLVSALFDREEFEAQRDVGTLTRSENKLGAGLSWLA